MGYSFVTSIKADVVVSFACRNKIVHGQSMVFVSDPAWPSGKALGWQAEVPRLETASALLSLQKLWSVDTVL